MNIIESTYKGSGQLTRQQFLFYEMRTTVPGDIEMLKAAGFDVHARRSRQNKYYLENINFELPELKILRRGAKGSAEFYLGIREHCHKHT